MGRDSFFSAYGSDWVRYSDYELREAGNGAVYITPAPGAVFSIYNLMEAAPGMVVDALNIGRMARSGKPEAGKLRRAALRFAKRYGLPGLMEYLPLNRNYFMAEETFPDKSPVTARHRMDTKEYMSLFIPFKKEPVRLEGETPLRPDEILGKPISFYVVFSNAYSEQPEWMITYFSDLYTHLAACSRCEKSDDPALPEQCRAELERLQCSRLACGVKLMDGRPALVWDFNSLLQALETMYAFYVTGKRNPIRICRDCGTVFFAASARSEFCRTKCRNRHNVAAFRQRQSETQ